VLVGERRVVMRSNTGLEAGFQLIGKQTGVRASEPLAGLAYPVRSLFQRTPSQAKGVRAATTRRGADRRKGTERSADR
jgi:hypothetical protein